MLSRVPEEAALPDFPGCITAGKTLDEARRMAVEALAMHIAGIFLVSVDVPAGKTVRINITARESQIEAIDRMADEAGMTRSAYLVRAGLERRLHKARQR